jgi:Tol biopolymer transport system component
MTLSQLGHRTGRRSRARDDEGIFEVNAADGTGLRHLTNISGVAAGLAWSPNGTEIAFADRSPTGYNAIYVKRSDGTGRRLLPATPNADEKGPAWSPDNVRSIWTLGAG